MSTWTSGTVSDETEHLALIAAALSLSTESVTGGAVREKAPSPWDTLGSWRIGAGGGR
jgi:hypothetical protein